MNKVPVQHIEGLKTKLEYKFTRVEGTTITVCHAFLPNGFMVGVGESACIDPAEFDEDLGRKYAKERAEKDATITLWQLEGYMLKVTGNLSTDFIHGSA